MAWQGGIIDRLEREIHATGSRKPKPDSVCDLEALALHAICEAFTKAPLEECSDRDGQDEAARAALTNARGAWLAAMNCSPAIYTSELKHRARNEQHIDAWEWGRSRPAEVRTCMKVARPIEMRQVSVVAPSARRVTALAARKALDDSFEVKKARFKKERLFEERRHQKRVQELKTQEDEYMATRPEGAVGPTAPPAAPPAAAEPPMDAAPPASAAQPAAAPPASAPPTTARRAAAPRAAAPRAAARPSRVDATPEGSSSSRARPLSHLPPAKKLSRGQTGGSRGNAMQQAAAAATAAAAPPRAGGAKRKAAADGEQSRQTKRQNDGSDEDDDT